MEGAGEILRGGRRHHLPPAAAGGQGSSTAVRWRERKGWKKEWLLGFDGSRSVAGFDRARIMDGRRIRSDGQRRPSASQARFGPSGVRARAGFPAQAHAVAWDAGTLCTERALGRFQDQAESTVRKRAQFFVFSEVFFIEFD